MKVYCASLHETSQRAVHCCCTLVYMLHESSYILFFVIQNKRGHEDSNSCSLSMIDTQRRKHCYTDSFNLERSTHIRTAPDFFGTTTIPAHQSVGSSTLLITPNVSIRRSSSLTFPIRGSGIRLGVLSENGMAPGFRLITYGCRTSPKPLHNFG